MHVVFADKNCLAMPHAAHMSFAAFVTVVFCACGLAMSVGDCDLNPLTRAPLATPAAAAHAVVMMCKMAMVVMSGCADSNRRVQAVSLG